MPSIIVVGSANMDIVTRVSHYPKPGETIFGEQTSFYSGGKGANQSIAAKRSGAEVHFVGALGNDFFGNELYRILREEAIDLNGMLKKAVNTGLALITVNKAGENNIILSPGANNELLPSDLDEIDWEAYEAVLLQNEIPWETNACVLDQAKGKGIKVVFNPAPAVQLSPETLQQIDLLILNEHEAASLTNIPIRHIDEAKAAAKEIILQGAKEVILTLGLQGSLYMNDKMEVVECPAYLIETVDTTGAGDTFIGSFVVRYLLKQDILSCLKYASAAAALAVSINGAQKAMPSAAEVAAFLAEKGEMVT